MMGTILHKSSNEFKYIDFEQKIANMFKYYNRKKNDSLTNL